MEPIDPNQAENAAARALLGVAGLDRAAGDEADEEDDEFEEEEAAAMDEEEAENDQQGAGVLNEVVLAQRDEQQDGPARVDLEKSSEESHSSGSSSPNAGRAQHHQPLPSLLQKAVVSVQKKLLQNNGDENGGRDGGGGGQAVSSDDDDSSEDNQGQESSARDSTQGQNQQQYTDVELRRLVLELAIVEQLIELRAIRAAPVLTNRSTIHEAAVLVWQKLQSQPGAEVLLDTNPAPVQPPAPAAPVVLPPQQQLFYPQDQQQAPANISFVAPTHAGLFASQQQAGPQVFPPPSANGISGPSVAPLLPPPPIAAVDQQTQALLMEILAGATTLLDPAWVQAQIVSDAEQNSERRKRQRCDNLYNFRYQDDESSSSYAPSG